MNYDIKDMLKKISMYDLFIAIVCAVLIEFLVKKYLLVFLLGLFIAYINFTINTILINYAVNVGKIKSINLISFVVRILLTALIGLLIYQYNKYNIIVYVAGYSLHFMALILYAINAKNN